MTIINAVGDILDSEAAVGDGKKLWSMSGCLKSQEFSKNCWEEVIMIAGSVGLSVDGRLIDMIDGKRKIISKETVKRSSMKDEGEREQTKEQLVTSTLGKSNEVFECHRI
ncbi:hypothetical protein AB6A40_009688 [Gnathostoma spinigerum]|uniref:Uncharacterized protein n=1 Tax=Gnathostoma spinigerum TaxID=75299 RepID=A0ABD6ESN4_9BILA